MVVCSFREWFGRPIGLASSSVSARGPLPQAVPITAVRLFPRYRPISSSQRPIQLSDRFSPRAWLPPLLSKGVLGTRGGGSFLKHAFCYEWPYSRSQPRSAKMHLI